MSKLILTSGFAIFSMFFGSGNLTYPLLLGATSSSSFLGAFLGFFITSIIIPYLGLLTVIMYQGDRDRLFSPLGKIGKFLINFTILGLLGPFAVVPRCIILPHGCFQALFPSLGLMEFSAGFAILLGIMIWKKDKVMDLIAYILSPLKLTSIILLLIFGFYFGDDIANIDMSLDYFQDGATMGYQIMDLLASLLFATSIYEHLSKNNTNKENLFDDALKAITIGIILMSLAYFAFLYIGAQYSQYLMPFINEPQKMLPYIAQYALGDYGAPFISLVIAMSCLTTATILSSIFADFLKSDIFCNKISYGLAMFLTILTAFICAQTGFMAIFHFLGMILTYIYPFLICYTLFRIANYGIIKFRGACEKN